MKFDEIDNVNDAFFNNLELTGGTDPSCLFEYINEKYAPDEVNKIIIFTDGQFVTPEQKLGRGSEVLWIINNKETPAPSWGRTIRKVPYK